MEVVSNTLLNTSENDSMCGMWSTVDPAALNATGYYHELCILD